MEKSSDRYLTSHPQRTSLMAIDMMHRAVKAYGTDQEEFDRCQSAFMRKLKKATTYTNKYSPLERIEYKDEVTSVLSTAHKIGKENPHLAVFEHYVEALFPQDAQLSNEIDAMVAFQEEASTQTSKFGSLTEEELDALDRKDDDLDTSEYYNSYKVPRFRR